MLAAEADITCIRAGRIRITAINVLTARAQKIRRASLLCFIVAVFRSPASVLIFIFFAAHHRPCGFSAGYYQTNSGQSFCNACEAGRYQQSASQTMCHNCPVGRYSSSQARTHVNWCGYCATGTFQVSAGKSVCSQPVPILQKALFSPMCVHWHGTGFS